MFSLFQGQTAFDVADTELLSLLEELKKKQAMVIKYLIHTITRNSLILHHRLEVYLLKSVHIPLLSKIVCEIVCPHVCVVFV